MKKALALSAFFHILLLGGGLYTFSAYASKDIGYASVQVQLINGSALGTKPDAALLAASSALAEYTTPRTAPQTAESPQITPPPENLLPEKTKPAATPSKPSPKEAVHAPVKPQKQPTTQNTSPKQVSAQARADQTTGTTSSSQPASRKETQTGNTANPLPTSLASASPHSANAHGSQAVRHNAAQTTGQGSGQSAGQSTAKVSAQPFGQASGPAFMRYKEPAYPSAAKRQGIAGEVLLRLYITENGRAQNIEVIRAPHESLGQAATTALASAIFQPYTVNGKAAACWTEIQVLFELH